MMDDEKWLEANDAVARGFASSVTAKPAKASAATRDFDLSACAPAPARFAAEAKAQAAPDLEAARQSRKTGSGSIGETAGLTFISGGEP